MKRLFWAVFIVVAISGPVAAKDHINIEMCHGPRAKEAIQIVKNYNISQGLSIGKMVERSLRGDKYDWSAEIIGDGEEYAVYVEYNNGGIVNGKMAWDGFMWTVNMKHRDINPDDVEKSIERFGDGHPKIKRNYRAQ